MKVIAVRQIHGSYGTKLAGEQFDVPDSLGSKLLARKAVRPALTYQAAAISPTSHPVTIEHHTPNPTNKRK